MLTLKDIKISKTRIPLQNAIWLRPIGGLKFKIYYPHGGSWAELGVTSSSDDDVTPSPKPSPTPTPSYTVSKASWEPMKVIVCKCIPMKARIGAKYYFADGRIKFNTRNGSGAHIYTYGFKGQDATEFSSYSIVPLWRRDNFNPMLVTIRSKDDYDADWQRVVKIYGDEASENDMIVKKFSAIYKSEIATVYYEESYPRNLNCDTTSPYFKVIDGHIRNINPVRMPKFCRSIKEALSESKHFTARKLKYRGKKIRRTHQWNFNYTAPDKLPIQLKRQWKKLSTGRFEGVLTIFPRTSWLDSFNKTFLVQQIIKNRKSVEKAVIRRYSKASRGSRGMFFAEFRRVVMIK